LCKISIGKEKLLQQRKRQSIDRLPRCRTRSLIHLCQCYTCTLHVRTLIYTYYYIHDTCMCVYMSCMYSMCTTYIHTVAHVHTRLTHINYKNYLRVKLSPFQHHNPEQHNNQRHTKSCPFRIALVSRSCTSPAQTIKNRTSE